MDPATAAPVTPSSPRPLGSTTEQRRTARRDTVSRRIRRLLLGMVAIIVALAAGGLAAAVLATNEVHTLGRGVAPAIDANDAALAAMLDAETGVRGYLLTHDRSYLQPYRLGNATVLARIAAIDTALHSVDNHDLDARVALERLYAVRWLDETARPIAQLRSWPVRRASLRAGRTQFDAFRRANAAVSHALIGRRERLQSSAHTLRVVVLTGIAVLVVLALLLAGVLGVRTARGVARPLDRLWAVVGRLQAGERDARADPTVGPVEVQAVAGAVNRLADEVQRDEAARGRADALRLAASRLTGQLRVGRDPHAVVRGLVAGIGTAFAVDRVWFTAVGDPRIPAIRRQWNRAGLDPTEAVPAATIAALREVADALWNGELTLAVTDRAVTDPSVTDPSVTDPADSAAAVPAALDAVLHRLGARTALVSAVGDGGSAMGLLVLVGVDAPREWTSTELNVLARICAELAQSLSQIHVLGQQREAMRRLRAADEAKTALVSTVSHELRTPLTSILGYLNLLLDPEASDALPPDVVGQLRVIERNATRLRALIEDLLLQSQIEADRLALVVSRIEVGEILAEVHETMRPLADQAGCALQTVLRDEDMRVDGDQLQLLQAVTNLVANAVKFSPGGGPVTVTATRVAAEDRERPRGEDVLITVADRGMGIPADEQSGLFGRFFRASNATAAVIPGTGLGLAIVAEIVRRHHGRIDVDSELGRGTTVEVRLPLAVPARPAAGTPAPGTVDGG